MKTILAAVLGALLFIAGFFVGNSMTGRRVLVPAGSAFWFSTERQADEFRNALGDGAAETIASRPGSKLVRTSRMLPVRLSPE